MWSSCHKICKENQISCRNQRIRFISLEYNNHLSYTTEATNTLVIWVPTFYEHTSNQICWTSHIWVDFNTRKLSTAFEQEKKEKKNIFLHLSFYGFQLSWWLSQFHFSMISIKIESKYIAVVSSQPANWVSYTHYISLFRTWSCIAYSQGLFQQLMRLICNSYLFIVISSSFYILHFALLKFVQMKWSFVLWLMFHFIVTVSFHVLGANGMKTRNRKQIRQYKYIYIYEFSEFNSAIVAWTLNSLSCSLFS